MPERKIDFPVDSVPADPSAARLVGLYPQKQEGFYMQRVQVPGGRIGTAQWRGLAEIARDLTPGYPLHVTTRQDVELHGVGGPDVPRVQQRLREAGLTGVSACGDSLRNVTSCPGAGLLPGTVDTAPIGATLKREAEKLPWIRSMPRKFKISISGCADACAMPWINDLGLVPDDGGTFRAIVAGSLGARPGTGVCLYEGLRPEELVPLLVGALRLFNEHGDRNNRRRARLRHVRERWGDDRFAAELDATFLQEKRRGDHPGPPVEVFDGDRPETARLQLTRGDISPGQALQLASVLEDSGGTLRLGLEHDLQVFADERPSLPPRLERLAEAARVVACPGTTWCPRGIADSRRAEERIREALPGGCLLSIGISGCPNNCAHAAVADIGLIGRGIAAEGGTEEGFRLFVGGGGRRSPALGEQLHAGLPASAVGRVVSRLAREYDRQALCGQSFGAFVRKHPAELTDAVEDELAFQAS
ncbi:MAG: nitrite/sulfite reductase [Candidatus Brocadiia bacterium]